MQSLWVKMLLSITLVFSTLAFAEEKKPPAKTIDELKTQIEELLEYHGIPGIGIAIVDRQQDRWVSGLGKASLEPEKPASAETLFRIGSISKMFVGLAALKLEEEGKLDLNAELKSIAPDVEFTNPWESTHPIKLVHLIEHTTGWDDIHLTEYANNDPKPLTLKEGLDFHPHSRTSRWKPGERMSYANSGPPVMAYVIEKITGQDFEDYVRENFFEPLDMQTATYRYPDNDHLLASLYNNKEKADYWHIIMRPSGSINASATDMSKLVRFFVEQGEANGEVILSKKSIRRMETPKSSLAAQKGLLTGYGLANYTSHHEEWVFRGHNGGVNGGLAELAYLRDHGIGYAFMINSGNGQGFREISKAIKNYLTFGLPVPKANDSQSFDPDKYLPYAGRYIPVNPRNEMFRFLENIFGGRVLKVNETGVTLTSGDEIVQYIEVKPGIFRTDKRAKPSLILMEDDDGLAIQVGTEYLKPIASSQHWLQIIVTWTFVGLVVLHLLWFWVWLVRWLSKKIPSGKAMSIRVLPFFSALSIVLIAVFFTVGQATNVFLTLGKPSFISISIAAFSILFAVFSVWGLLLSIKSLSSDINPWAKYFCFFTNSIFIIVTLYLAYFGIIGVRTFA